MYARMCMCLCMGAIIGSVWQGSGSFFEVASLVEQEPFCKMFDKTASPVELGCKIVGAAWSHVFVAPPPQWKPEGAPGAAPWLELLHFRPFGRAPAGADFGAGAGALPNRAKFSLLVCILVSLLI